MEDSILVDITPLEGEGMDTDTSMIRLRALTRAGMRWIMVGISSFVDLALTDGSALWGWLCVSGIFGLRANSC